MKQDRLSELQQALDDALGFMPHWNWRENPVLNVIVSPPVESRVQQMIADYYAGQRTVDPIPVHSVKFRCNKGVIYDGPHTDPRSLKFEAEWIEAEGHVIRAWYSQNGFHRRAAWVEGVKVQEA